MADPQLLVDQSYQCQHFRTAALGHLEIESAGDMQCLEFGQPGEGDVIAGPATFNRDRYFILIVAVKRPVVDRGKLLHHIDGMFDTVKFNRAEGHGPTLGLR